MAKKITNPSISTKNIDRLEKYYKQLDEYSLMPLRLVGTTPLLMHAWGAKALINMIGKMTGHEMPRVNKDLTEEYQEAFYRNTEDQTVIPCRIVKRCLLNGALATKKAVTKVDVGRYLRVVGQTAPIIGEPRMDVRLAVLSRGTPIPVARPIFDEWSIEVVVRFTHAFLSAEKVVLAAETAGDAVGFLEWRPSSNSPGEFGCFRVEHVPATEIDRIIHDNRHAEKVPVIPDAFLRAAGAVKDTLPENARNALGGILAAKPGKGRRKNGHNTDSADIGS
jgi:hypothetical protein